jgi:hypothetical protein
LHNANYLKIKFENFLKQLGDSPKKKRNISANVQLCDVPMERSGIGIWATSRIARVVRCVARVYYIKIIFISKAQNRIAAHCGEME